jgi:predicted amino acid racemase
MFLEMTLRRNPRLIETAVKLHRAGEITPNTYLIDVDAIRANVRLLVQAARDQQLTLYMMTKQLGRNPDLARIIAEAGIERAVAVDPWEALTLGRAGIQIGNVGHLVQVPSRMIPEILALEPEVVTVFSLDKAREISEAALRLGKRQALLLKVVGPLDTIYEGQLGGVAEAELLPTAAAIMRLPGVAVAGVTSFPCFLYDAAEGRVKPTENAATVLRGAELLRRELGLTLEQINTPSANMASTFPLLRRLGATHAEPGHAITGTTPLHACQDQPELPAMVYVSEISHIYQDKAYAVGGGFYRRSQVKEAMVGTDFMTMTGNRLEAEEIAPESIDYYGTLRSGGRKVRVGDTAIYAFRTQIFVTRSEVALVEGVQRGSPRISGIYDSQGKKLR